MTGSGSFIHDEGLGATFPLSQPTTIAYSVRTSDVTGSNSGYVVIMPSSTTFVNSSLIFSYFNSTCNCLRIVAGGAQLNISASNNTWYDVVLENIDWAAKNFDVKVNGIIIAYDFPFRDTSINGVSYISLYNYNGGASAYWDDIDINGAAITSNIEIDASGNLVYTDADGVDDSISVVIDGANYRLSDPNGKLVAGNGTTQDGTDVLAPIASVTGEIQINTQDGNDLLEVDFSGGNFSNSIAYSGGFQAGASGDILSLKGGASFASVTHNFINENDGSVAVTGNGTITYTGLEPVIDNLVVARPVSSVFQVVPRPLHWMLVE